MEFEVGFSLPIQTRWPLLYIAFSVVTTQATTLYMLHSISSNRVTHFLPPSFMTCSHTTSVWVCDKAQGSITTTKLNL